MQGICRVFLIVVALGYGCSSEPSPESEVDKVAANDEIARFIQSFEGRGDLSDESQPTPASHAVKQFSLPDDLQIELVLSEPEIHQPVEINFDHQGRLWVVQYNQYPYPEDLKVTSIDNHLRVKFDKVPDPPPAGAAGADKITFFEDKDGDGVYEKATDAITGLNIATSVIVGRGKIWVLNPPYLLAYPDPDDDGLPNGDPEVHLRGFGLEDTHAVANSLTWGPDGWIYGAQGSTTTANISSEVSKNIGFLGQAIWRYQPETKVFEIFAEGGGNTFDVELDAKGRIYSGDNGTDRGQYYKQGAYYTKNWGKHGPHTNPFSLGHLPNMALEGDRKRFTHAWIKYEGATLPQGYRNKMIAINPLQSYLQLTRFESNGSTFKNYDEERILETPDHWFRPVDIKAGPDGNVYLADWYDSRLSHVDPRDTWHKSSGRIYRLKPKSGPARVTIKNLAQYPADSLITRLSHPDKWVRQQVLRVLGDRRDLSIIPKILPLFRAPDGQTALEALWAIHLSGGLSEDLVLEGLNHADTYVRMWTVRLLGDRKNVTPGEARALTHLAQTEHHPEVRSQLAATAKRLPAYSAIPVIRGLLLQEKDVNDPDIPLQIWWAVESKTQTDGPAIIGMFKERKVWASGIMQKTVLARLSQRYIMSGREEDLAMCTQLLQLAPGNDLIKPLLTGIQEGLRGRNLASLPKDLLQALQPYTALFGDGPLALGIRQGDPESVEKALAFIKDPQENLSQRLSYIRLFGESTQPSAVIPLLEIVENQRSSGALRQAALFALMSYADDVIGERISRAYPDRLRADPDTRVAALSLMSSRKSWATQLLYMITGTRQIASSDLPEDLVMRLVMSDDPEITERAGQIWPETRLSSPEEKEQAMARVRKLLSSGKGDSGTGKRLFQIQCGACHKMLGEGGELAPDLTGYDRTNLNDLLLNIVDPHADIREGYVYYMVRTNDNRTIIGTIASRQGENVTIQTSTGEKIHLRDDQVKEMKARQRSLMPEKILDRLSDQQIRDLFAYLREKP
jgi:putative heme-binding domain-containing protein